MAPGNGRVSTRRSNKNKKEPQTAGSNAAPGNKPAAPAQSLPRDDKLPAEKPNINKSAKAQQGSTPPESVSDISFKYIDKRSEADIPTSTGKNLNKEDYPTNIEHLSYSSPSETHVRALNEMGDNRGNLSSTSPGLPNTSQMFLVSPHQQLATQALISTPDDPWHLTFNELKVMQARMGTLEKLEAAILDFARQLQAINNRTNDTEKKISDNADEIKELKEEITKRRDTVESQQSTIQNLHKIKDDFTKNSKKIVSTKNEQNITNTCRTGDSD